MTHEVIPPREEHAQGVCESRQLEIQVYLDGNNNEIYEKVANNLRRWGNVYLHIYAIGGISALCVAIKYRIGDEHLSYTNHNHNQNLVDSIRENLTNGLGTNISILNIFLGSSVRNIKEI